MMTAMMTVITVMIVIVLENCKQYHVTQLKFLLNN